MSRRSVKTSVLRQMASFGIHSFLIGMSAQAQNQTPQLVIGHFLPAAFVGFYNVAIRLIQYIVEFIGRIGVVTNTNAAQFAARNETGLISQLAIYTNRYALSFFLPIGIFLYTHGSPFFAKWVGQRVASHSAPLLPVLLLGYLLGAVGQSCSGMLLMGIGKHQRYARGQVAETVLGFLLMWFVVPRYGILGAAFVISTLMILNRGLYTSWLVSRVTGQPFLRYLHGVYARPAAVAVPVAGLALWLRSTVLPGQSWAQLVFLAGILGITYYALAFFFCLEREHRASLLNWIAAKCGIR
jgi:O-antigen/teichoic acid export membrane protein